MADFYTTNKEENLINRVIREGLGYKEGEGIYKYHILRLAIALSLKLEKIQLFSSIWEDKKLGGERNGGKEYHLAQITGKSGNDKKEDFDTLLRAVLYMRHKEELTREKINIFENEKTYLSMLEKYIKRGLYEIEHSYKSSDCFYQWLIDNLKLASLPQKSQNLGIQSQSEGIEGEYFSRLERYFKEFDIDIGYISEEDSYRHRLCKIEVKDATKLTLFRQKSKELRSVLASEVSVDDYKNVPKGFVIQIAKSSNEWQNLGQKEYEIGLKALAKENFKLGIFAGMDIDKKPFCFDLATAPHLFVAGTTGSGKTNFLKVMIDTLLRNENVEIIVIDPKYGVDYSHFGDKITLIDDMSKTNERVSELCDEMDRRYKQMTEVGTNDIEKMNLPYIVLVIDELNDLVTTHKGFDERLARLAKKGRQSGIHLVLGSQRPDSKIFAGELRSNIPSRIALKVQKSTESKIILDETGAEKLLGSGDMLIKLNNMSEPKHILSVYITF